MIWLNPRSKRGDHSGVLLPFFFVNTLCGEASSNSTKQKSRFTESPMMRSQAKSPNRLNSVATRSKRLILGLYEPTSAARCLCARKNGRMSFRSLKACFLSNKSLNSARSFLHWSTLSAIFSSVFMISWPTRPPLLPLVPAASRCHGQPSLEAAHRPPQQLTDPVSLVQRDPGLEHPQRSS